MNNEKIINIILRGFLFKPNHTPYSSRRLIAKSYNIDFFKMGIEPYIDLINKLQKKYIVNIYFSTYDTTPSETINEIKKTFTNAEIILSPEINSYQFTTTSNALKKINIDADFTIVLRSDLILKQKFINLICSVDYDPNKIMALAQYQRKGLGFFDILHIIPRSLKDAFTNILDTNRPKDLHKLWAIIPTALLCGKRMFYTNNCRSNNTGCAEFYTVYDGIIKNTQYNFNKETFRCHNLYITPDNGVLSDDLIIRMTGNKWESAEARAIQSIDSNASVLDLGGCIGIISCLINKKLQNPNNHVVLEANPRLIYSLTGIRDENLCKFQIENSILGEHVIDKMKFFVNPYHAMDGSIFPSSKRTIETEISQTTIVELEKKYSLNFNTFICDIEGAEWDLWQKILMPNDYFKKFNNIICEYHHIKQNHHILEKIKKLLVDANYKIIQYSEQVYSFIKISV